jgi:dihydroflavonol-4-reductase
MFDVAEMLRRRLGAAASRAPRRQLPDVMVRLAALFNPAARQALPELGKIKAASSEKARRELGWSPRANEEAIAATAESLLRFGLVATPASARS